MKTLTFKTHKNTNIQAKFLKQFESIEGLEIDFEALDEDISPADCFDYQKNIDYVQRQYDNGNGYAWFCAKVTVKYRGYEATDYLGACSYKSAKDFKENSGYYIDMINQCVDQINDEIAARNAAICQAFKLRNLKRTAAEMGFVLFPKASII